LYALRIHSSTLKNNNAKPVLKTSSTMQLQNYARLKHHPSVLKDTHTMSRALYANWLIRTSALPD
jgi:hypothetical protein